MDEETEAPGVSHTYGSRIERQKIAVLALLGLGLQSERSTVYTTPNEPREWRVSHSPWVGGSLTSTAACGVLQVLPTPVQMQHHLQLGQGLIYPPGELSCKVRCSCHDIPRLLALPMGS